jgi:DNA-binding transcriptional ArsR family regulator
MSAIAKRAAAFAALGDEQRLGLVAKLSGGEPRSIAQLSAGTKVTRQAIAKHLRVLEGAGIVRGEKSGRECLYVLAPAPFADLADYLSTVSRQWDATLARLKTFVEG